MGRSLWRLASVRDRQVIHTIRNFRISGSIVGEQALWDLNKTGRPDDPQLHLNELARTTLAALPTILPAPLMHQSGLAPAEVLLDSRRQKCSEYN